MSLTIVTRQSKYLSVEMDDLYLDMKYIFPDKHDEYDIPHYLKQIQTCGTSANIVGVNRYNDVIMPGAMPNTIKYLQTGDYNKLLQPGVIPSSVIDLTIGPKYNRPLVRRAIPYGVVILKFGDDFNQPLDYDIIPDSVVYLSFGKTFDQDIRAGYIPNSVTHLTFDTSLYNKPFELGSIPVSVTYLDLGRCYDHVLHDDSGNSIIPSSVTHLVLSRQFNQHISPNDIPRGVTSLIFREQYNQPLDKTSLPATLTHLTFGDNFNQVIGPDVLPNSLKHITFGRKFKHELCPGAIPPGLRTITIVNTMNANYIRHVPHCVALYMYVLPGWFLTNYCDIDIDLRGIEREIYVPMMYNNDLYSAIISGKIDNIRYIDSIVINGVMHAVIAGPDHKKKYVL